MRSASGKKLNRKTKLRLIATIENLEAKIDAQHEEMQKVIGALNELATNVLNVTRAVRSAHATHKVISAPAEAAKLLSSMKENTESSMRTIQTAFQIASSIEKNAEAIVSAMKGSANGIPK